MPDQGESQMPVIADPRWLGSRIVGHTRLPTWELRWIVERADGTQRRIVAVEVDDDWQTPLGPRLEAGVGQ